MTSSTTKQNRTTLQNNIRNKQQLFSRFNRRMSASNSPAERSFIKNEMNRICKELTSCARQWKSCGFGNNTWVTRNVNSKTTTSNNMNSNKSNASTRSNRTTTNSRRSTRSTTGKRTKRTTTASNRKTTNNPWMFSFSR